MKIQSIEVGISYTEVKHQLNTEIKETTIEGQVSIQHIYDYETHDSILDKSDRVVRLALVSFKIPLSREFATRAHLLQVCDLVTKISLNFFSE